MLQKDVRDGDWAAADIPQINSLQLLTAKPSIVLCNMTPDDYIRKKNKFLPKLAAWVKGEREKQRENGEKDPEFVTRDDFTKPSSLNENVEKSVISI